MDLNNLISGGNSRDNLRIGNIKPRAGVDSLLTSNRNSRNIRLGGSPISPNMDLRRSILNTPSVPSVAQTSQTPPSNSNMASTSVSSNVSNANQPVQTAQPSNVETMITKLVDSGVLNLNNRSQTVRDLTENNDFNVSLPQDGVVEPNTLDANGGFDDLTTVRNALIQKVMGQVTGDGDDELTSIRNRAIDVQNKLEKDIEDIENSGMIRSSADAEIAKLTERAEEKLGDLAQRESVFLGRNKEITDILGTISQIQELTGASPVGSSYQDPVTGDVKMLFRDPLTGEVSEKLVGRVTPEPETGNLQLTEVNGQRVVVDMNSGQVVSTLGPTDSGFGSLFGSGFGPGADVPSLNVLEQVAGTFSTKEEREGASGAIGTIREAEDLVASLKNSNTGILSGTGAKLGRMVGLTSDAQNVFNAKATVFTARFIKALSGAQVTDKEREFLMNALPSEFKTYQNNLAGLGAILEWIDNNYSGKLGADLGAYIPQEVQQILNEATSVPQNSGGISDFSTVDSNNSFSDL